MTENGNVRDRLPITMRADEIMLDGNVLGLNDDDETWNWFVAVTGEDLNNFLNDTAAMMGQLRDVEGTVQGVFRRWNPLMSRAHALFTPDFPN